MIAAIVLAAGEASRFGAPKQRLLLGDVLDALQAARSIGSIVVVEGAHSLDGVDLTQRGVRVARCVDWERGPGASLRCGLATLPAETEAAVVVLADGPELSPAVVDRIADAWAGRAGDLVAASYDGERGHPLALGRILFDEIPDHGLRDHVPVLVACDDLGSPGDVDTPDDLPDRYRGV